MRPWQEHVRRIVGELPAIVGAADDDGPVVVWSLLSANNRDLAHGAKLYGQLDDAVIDARLMILEQSNLEIRLVRGERERVFGWSLNDGGTAELVCPRWYRTDRERLRSIGLATMALPAAIVSDGAHLARTPSMATDRKHPLR